MKRLALLVSLFALLVGTLACNLLSPRRPTPAVTPDAVATSVEATVKARLGEAPPAAATAQPTPTLEPTAAPAAVPLTAAYLDSAGSLWVWREGQSPRRLAVSAQVSSLRLSPDGQKLAFSALGKSERSETLGTIPVAGGAAKIFVSDVDFANMVKGIAGASAGGPGMFDWTPDSARVAFVSRAVFDGPGFLLSDDLWVGDPTTAELRKLLPAGQGGQFAYSPDGRQVALVTPTEIALANADGSERRTLLDYKAVVTYSEYNYYAAPVWSPDSRYLLVAIPPDDPMAEPARPTAVWKLPIDGSTAQKLCEIQVSFLAPVSFSPDLQRMMYVAAKIAGGASPLDELHIARVDGSADSVVLAGRLSAENWSPDSSHFVFSQDDGYQIGQVDSEFWTLTSGGRVTGLHWVDASRFVYAREIGGAWELRLGQMGGGDQLIASLGKGVGYFPTFDVKP